MNIDVSINSVHSQLLRYLVVGAIAFIVDISLLYLLTESVHYHYLLAAAIAFSFGLITNYWLSIAWVFDYRALRNPRLEFMIFTAIGLVGLILNEVILYVLTEQLAIYYVDSKIISTGMIFIFNFGMRKIMLFSRHKTDNSLMSSIPTK